MAMAREGATGLTEVLLIRHGETAWNTEGRLQGVIDIPLNDRGKSQAARVAAYLAEREGREIGETSGRRTEAVFTSDLQRAGATAQEISKRLSAKVVTRKEFREKCLGVIEGMTLEEARVKEPEAYEKWRRGKGCPGAEDKGAVMDRVRSGLADIERNFSGKRVVVVTHGGILNIVHRILTGEKFPGKIPNTSISTITKSVGKGGYWRIESYAVCDHLGEGEFDNKAFGGVGETG